MPKLIVVEADGSKQELAASNGLSVMEILRDAGLVVGECNGSLACATCHVVVEPEWYGKIDEITEAEEDMLDTAFNVTATSRLCCKIMVCDDLDGLTIRLPG